MLTTRRILLSLVSICVVASLFFLSAFNRETGNPKIFKIKQGFINPPASARPGVYWYFMDGNMSKEGMTKDLESMKQAGIGNVLFLEVNVGVPRGKVDFFSEQWQELFGYMIKETKRLGINVSLGIGPGWAGSGGPWVKPEQSMQDLVSSSVEVSGSQDINIKLPVHCQKRRFLASGHLHPK